MGFVSKPSFRKKLTMQLPVAIALWATASAVIAIETHENVQDLRYGVSLYHYYVGEYPKALTTLMLAEAEGGIKGHKDYPQVMDAGIRLAFGMRTSAQQKFNILLTEDKPAIVRDTANYYLTKLHYLQSDYASAGASASIVGDTIDSKLLEDLKLLRVHMAIKTNADDAEITRLLNELDSGRILALYNLGNAAARANDNLKAKTYYQEAIQSPYPDNAYEQREYLAIRDKVYTALGFIYLREENYIEALVTFPKVRLDKGQTNQALLGYGWAAARNGNYLLALKPWQALRKGSLLDSSVQESLLALPWAYEQLQETDAALGAYRESETLLTAEYRHVEALATALDYRKVIAALESNENNVNEDDAHKKSSADALIASPIEHVRHNWLTLGARDVAQTSSSYLEHLFRRNIFQVDTQQLRDLIALKQELVVWENKLDVYKQLLLDKKTRRNAREAAIIDTHYLDQYKSLSLAHERLEAQLNTIKENNRYLALANADTQDLNKRVARSIKNLAFLEQQSSSENIRIPFEAKARLRFFSGVLQGRAAQQFPQRIWNLEKQLNQTKQALSISETSSPRIASLFAASLDITEDLARIAVLHEKTGAEISSINTIINQQGLHVSNQITAQLQTHKTRLQNYLAQTRLSLAQLYDAAYRKNLDAAVQEQDEPNAEAPQ